VRIVVVGAGVVGLSCAFSLVRDGHDVQVLDAARPGGGASAGNAGWVTPSLATPLASPGILSTGIRSALDPKGALVIRPALDTAWLRWLWRFARSSRPAAYSQGVRALLAITRHSLDALDEMRSAGVEFEEHRAGLLAVARDRDGLHWFELLFAELRALGFPGGLEAMDGAQARALEPALGDVVTVATHATIDRHVAPESLVAGLATFVQDAGGLVRPDQPVQALRRDGAAWIVDCGAAGLVSCDLVVVSAALGSIGLLRPLGLRLPLVGAKGYSVTLPGLEVMPRVPLYLSEPKLGLTPLESGLRIAGFFELGTRDPAPNERRARQLVDETRPFLRHLADAEPVEGPAGWAGFRPATPDSLPLLGPVPGAPGIIVATGHGMLGVTLAPATGRAVALLVRGTLPDWVVPFDPGRFQS
jgi:D-amino-acid dehydrogenase